MDYKNSDPPAYDEVAVQRRKNALFNISNSTLSGTSSWHSQVFISLFLSFGLFLNGLYHLDMANSAKAASLVSFLFCCYVSVTLSGIVRHRDEAEKLSKYAQGTDLYNISIVKTLQGSDTKYYFHWVALIVSIISSVGTIFSIDMPSERRAYLVMSCLLLLNTSFTSTKTQRDCEDSAKWKSDYDAHGKRSD